MRKIFLYGISFLIFLILLMGILFTDVILHEKAHINAAEKFNITLKIKEINYLPDLNNLSQWGKGSSEPASYEDCEKFNSLEVKDKMIITHAGVETEMFFLMIVYIVLFIFTIKYFKFLWINNIVALILLSTLIMLPLFILLSSFKENVFSLSPTVDWRIFYIDCSAYS